MEPQVRRWLRAEGVVAFVGGLLAWIALGGEWPWFLILLLAPDASIAGYALGPRVGALTYNTAHSWATGGAIAIAGWLVGVAPAIFAGVLLIAHAGIDRALGYGLKASTGFQDTHLGRIGRRRG
jgi:hypothetical protein